MNRPRRSMIRRFAVGLLGAVTALVGMLALAVSPGASSAQAADLSRFDAGFIISDRIFYDFGTMGAADIQAFLSQRGASCVSNADGTPCLKNFHQATTSRAADTRCTHAYEGAADESAAQIIAKVATACGINPRVLLVTLQKEQSLVTRTTAGSAAVYRKAMGYGCPDTSVCDALYYGFFNQVYSAASQFRNYANNPSKYAHQAGMTNNIRYSPDATCGSSPVFIQNQATASLYNYTPYQPNAAALHAGYGTGDSCSAYGNRNFWNFFFDWFGSPTGVSPIGFIDSVTTTVDSITASGWALDPDTTAPITVHMYVDGSSTAFTADGPRPDVDTIFHKGANHGFTISMPASLGAHSVCVWALNTDVSSGNTLLGCRTVIVNAPPIGFIDSVTTTSTSVTATGWALDPDTQNPIAVHMYVDGSSTAFTADGPRPDVDTVFHKGANHGFTTTMTASAGSHHVCLYAINDAPGPNTGLGCRTVTVG